MKGQAPLPRLSFDEFVRELAGGTASVLGAEASALAAEARLALYVHYQELRRWNRSLSLIGPGTVDEVLSRHYGESLAVLSWIDPRWKSLVDIGSGGGFPGAVLSAAVPALATVLIEARQRKAVFLQTVAGKAALNCRCLNARVSAPLPPGLPAQIDLLTARAIKVPVETLDALASRLSASGRLFLWAGQELPAMPAGLVLDGTLPLSGSDHRRVLRYKPLTFQS